MAAAVEVATVATAEVGDTIACMQSNDAEKSNLWLKGVLSCMSSVLGLFGRADLIDEDESFYVKSEKVIESSCIGQGAQGKVHLATLKRRKEKVKVAIKHVQQIDDMTVRHLRNIKHENIVQTIGVCINPPKYFIIMEYCQNGSLFDYMREGHDISPIQIITWARGIASGMHLLHNKNIIHRDLKSPNILITIDLTAKISDFGTSRTIDDHSKMMSFAGTLNWMAPEVIRAEKYSNKVDVWSFGVVVWELVTKQIPYFKMEQHAIMWGVGTDSVCLPIPPGLPVSIKVLLVQCWNRRYIYRPSFADVIKSLDLISEELLVYDQTTFVAEQNVWAEDARKSLETAFLRSEEQYRKRIPAYTKLDLYNRDNLKEKLEALDERLETTNNMFFEICSIRLALERRERELALKERFVDACHCGVRKILKLHRQMTSSSDGLSFYNGYRAHLMKPEYQQMLVNIINDKTITSASKHCDCEIFIDREKIRKDSVESKKETVVAKSGFVDFKNRPKPVFGKRAPRGIAIAAV